MRQTPLSFMLVVVMTLLTLTTDPAGAATEVGKAVAVRGRVTIERNNRKFDAKVKSPIEASDTITTADASKIKLLFTDDSVLTLAEKTKMSVKEYVHNKETRGKSVYNLIDGKMRAVVGKTKFEVQTPTAVAAARGTVIFFEVGSVNGMPFTRIICLEGVVGVKNTAPAPPTGMPAGTPAPVPVTPQTTDLTPGTMITVFAGQPLPAPIPAPPAVIEKLKQETATKVSSNDPAPSTTGTYDITTPTATTTGGKETGKDATTSSTDISGNPDTKPTVTAVQEPTPVITLPDVPKNIATPPVIQVPPTQHKGVKINIGIPTVISPAPSGSSSGSPFKAVPR